MMTKDDLLQEFGEVHDAHGCCFAEYAVATYSIYCCLRLATDQTIAVVSRNINDPAFAADVALRAPASLPMTGQRSSRFRPTPTVSPTRWRCPARITGS